MKTVLIADDHVIVREGIKRIINDHPDMQVGDEASTGAEVLKLAGEKDYDVIVLDINMPNISGLDALKQLTGIQPDTPVLILSMYPENQYAIRTLKAGAAGYLTKEAAPENLINAIEKILSGGRFITPELAEELAFSVGKPSEEYPHHALSDREYQIMCAIASGKSATQIAEDYHLSVKTVSTYRTRVLDKMNFENNSQLTHYVIKNDLLL